MPSTPLGPLRERVRAAALPLATFLGTALASAAGYVLLTGVGPVTAVFWVLDPTSVELYFEHHEGPERATKAFAVVSFVALALAGIWVGESALDAAFDGRIREELTRMTTQRAIDDLSGHVVVCGHGMFGRTVVDRLQERGREVVVVETDPDERERIDEGTLVVAGDARREETLEAAGVERADAVVAAIDDSNANVQIGVATSQLAPEARLVVRVGDEMYESTARRVGADSVVIPEVVSGSDLATDLLDGPE